jgi:DNA polymerase III epsilon subunit-like protein
LISDDQFYAKREDQKERQESRKGKTNLDERDRADNHRALDDTDAVAEVGILLCVNGEVSRVGTGREREEDKLRSVQINVIACMVLPRPMSSARMQP